MSKHTPGPWWFAENIYSFAVGAGDKEIAFVGQTERQSVTLHEQSKANACLIAAAPELLEACEAVLHDAELRGVSIQAPYNTVRNAIKKAKGE